MGEWVGGEWVWKWEWRRNLFGREESSFNNLLALLTSCRLSEHTNDRWVWRPTSDGNYSTSSAYDEAVRQEVAVVNAAVQGVRFSKVWNKIVPLKVASLTWRTMWDRIPTKKNLVRRSIIPSRDSCCALCNGDVEDVNHIFLGCPMVREVWDNMYSWIGITTVQHKDVKHHFEAHSGLVKGKKKASFMVSLWECVIWTIWKARNKIIFENGAFCVRKIVDEIKGMKAMAVSYFYCLESIRKTLDGLYKQKRAKLIELRKYTNVKERPIAYEELCRLTKLHAKLRKVLLVRCASARQRCPPDFDRMTNPDGWCDIVDHRGSGMVRRTKGTSCSGGYDYYNPYI